MQIHDDDIYEGLEEEEGDDSDSEYEDDNAFDIDVHPVIEGEHDFRTKNDGHELHRDDITQSKGALRIRCNMIDVVHGKWKAKKGEDKGTKQQDDDEDSDYDSDYDLGLEEEEYATLAVFLFRFDTTKNSRRISRVEMKLNFIGQDEYSRPEVHSISFNERLSLAEENASESVTMGAEGTIGASFTPAQLSGTLKAEKATSRDTRSYTTLIGATYKKNYNRGADDQANWVMLENETLKTGVPVALRVGVLLRRRNLLPFQCEAEISVQADIKSRLGQFFGKKDENDPILFDPAVQGRRKLQAVRAQDLDNLGSFDLSSIATVTFKSISDEAIRRV